MSVAKVLKFQPKENLVDEFLKHYASEATISNYRSDIKQFFGVEDTSEITIAKMKKITMKKAKKYFIDLIDKTKPSRETVMRRKSALSIFFATIHAELVEEGDYLYTINPFNNESISRLLNNKLPKASSLPNGRALTLEEIQVIMDNTTDPKERLVFRFLMNTSVRAEELATICYKDFFKIPNGEWRLQVYGKGRKERVVFIHDDIIEEIQMWRSGCIIGKDNLRVFEFGSSRSVNNYIKEIMQKYNITGITAHKLRHSSLTILAMDMHKTGITLPQLQDHAGHNDIRTTQKYIHLAENYQGSAGKGIHI